MDNKELSFIEKLSLPLKTLWEQYKIFLLLFGIIILVLKFRTLIMDLMIGNVYKIFNNSKDKNDSLQKEENDLNNKANQLRKEANELPKETQEVDENWNLKK